MKFPDIGGGSNGKQAGLFIRMKDGDRIQGIFKGDPHIYRLHWIEKRSYECVGKDSCEYCKSGDKPKFRFKINFLTKEDGTWLAKIFEGNYGTFKDLKEMHENSYALPETFVSVARSGDKQNTRYVVMPVKANGGLKPDQLAKLDKIPLNELSGKADAEPEHDDQDANESVPF